MSLFLTCSSSSKEIWASCAWIATVCSSTFSPRRSLSLSASDVFALSSTLPTASASSSANEDAGKPPGIPSIAEAYWPAREAAGSWTPASADITEGIGTIICFRSPFPHGGKAGKRAQPGGSLDGEGCSTPAAH